MTSSIEHSLIDTEEEQSEEQKKVDFSPKRDRYIYEFVKSVKLDFDSVYFEDETEVSANIVESFVKRNILKRFYKPCFHWIQALIYSIVVIPVGLIMSMLCGIVYGVTRVVVVWIIQPCIKYILFFLNIIGMFHRVVIRLICDPFCESLSLSLSQIRGGFSFMSTQGQLDNSPETPTKTILA